MRTMMRMIPTHWKTPFIRLIYRYCLWTCPFTHLFSNMTISEGKGGSVAEEAFVSVLVWSSENEDCVYDLLKMEACMWPVQLLLMITVFDQVSNSWLPPLSTGLPDRLPDAVRPAAVLQHVLRPPQQRRADNPAVDRPLAPPPRPVCHSKTQSSISPDTLLLPHRLCSHEFTNKKFGMSVLAEGEDGVGRDACTYPEVLSFCTHVMGGRTLPMTRWETAQEVGGLPVLESFQMGREERMKSPEASVGQWNMNRLFWNVQFVTKPVV